jgi:hypothetical protein
VAKRQRRLSGVDEMVISLSAKGLTTGGVQAHLAEVYGAQVSRQTISTSTDKVIEGMLEWQNRPLDPAPQAGRLGMVDPASGHRSDHHVPGLVHQGDQRADSLVGQDDEQQSGHRGDAEQRPGQDRCDLLGHGGDLVLITAVVIAFRASTSTSVHKRARCPQVGQ